MNRTKKIISLLSVFLICFSVFVVYDNTGIVAMAKSETYEIPELSLTLNIPENTYIFTAETSNDDPLWGEAGLSDPVKYKTDYNEMGILAHLSTDNGATNIYISKKESDTTKSYFSLAEMKEKELSDFVAQYNVQDDGTMKSTGELYPHKQVPFVKTDIVATYAKEGEELLHETVFFTIINGYTAAFSTWQQGEVSEKSLAFVKQLIDSVNFTKVIPAPEVPEVNIAQGILGLAVIALLIALIIAFFVITKHNAKKRKIATRKLAERLSIYRQERQLKGEIERISIFENTTPHSDEAIREFSKYQTYRKNVLMPTVSITVSIVGAVVSIIVNAEWWITLLLAACAAFCIYRLATSAYTIEKSLKKVYKNMKSRDAKYTFYKNEFTISGMQKSSDYPYFQITDIRENKNIMYLYFGEFNTYFVNKNNFTKGDAEAFKKFIIAKANAEKGKKL